jgi:hypothetical protein
VTPQCICCPHSCSHAAMVPCIADAARSIVNDSYWLDATLLHPPYMIALAAIYIACAYMELDVTMWFDALNVNRKEVRVSAVPRVAAVVLRLVEAMTIAFTSSSLSSIVE